MSKTWEYRIATALIALPLLYGLNLYYSTNSDINDPIVPPYWPIAKDILMLSIIASLLYVNRRIAIQAISEAPIFTLGALCLSASALVLMNFGLSRETASFSKNAMLYQATGAIISYVVVNRIGAELFRRSLVVAIYSALLIGLLLLLHPVYSHDGRAYGTYGNPTSFGFSVVIVLGMAIWMGAAAEIILASIASAIAYLVTGSMSVIIAVCFITGSAFVYEALKGGRPKVHFIAGCLFVTLILAACYVQYSVHREIFIGADRILGFLGDPSTLKTTDSITVRWADFLWATRSDHYHRFDSYILSLRVNIGFTPIVLYTALIISIISMYVKSGGGRQNFALFSLLIALLLINPMLQHQLEVFPTNLLFTMVLGVSVYAFSVDRQRQGSRHPDNNANAIAGETRVLQ